jgi:hypothetical protein
VTGDCTINLDEAGSGCGICYDEIKDHYDFNIITYFRDFKEANDIGP